MPPDRTANERPRFSFGTRVRAQLNGVDRTYDGAVVAAPEHYREDPRYRDYVWVLPDDLDRPVPWRETSLTVIEAAL